MLSVCRCRVNERIVLARPSRKLCVCCSCKRTALLLIGLVRERDIHPFSLAPPPLVTACIIDPEQLHFLSVSKLIRCSAFTYPDPIRPSSSFLWKPHFPPIYLCLCSFSSKMLLYHCCSEVFLNPLCIFQHCSCLILIWTLFCLLFFPFIHLNHLSSFPPVFTAVSSTSVNLWLHFFALSCCSVNAKIRLQVILRSWRNQLPLIAFGEEKLLIGLQRECHGEIMTPRLTYGDRMGTTNHDMECIKESFFPPNSF